MNCPDENTVAALFEQRLSEADAARVEAHVDDCAACRRLLGGVAGLLESTGGATTVAEGPARAPRVDDEALISNGTTVGRYVVIATIGAGGMGIVFKAYDPELDRKVALKLVRTDRMRDSRGVGGQQRLIREAKAMARLSHPNVVNVYDAGTFGDRVFLAMELVDGVTLTAWLADTARSWRDVLSVFVEAGRGLAAAHAAGLVHRDFKPDNVLVSRHGHVKVTDFGLARTAATPGTTHISDRPGPPSSSEAHRQPPGASTKTGSILGTPAYMAPEQRRGEPADARSDQFSFCVALRESLAKTSGVPSRVESATRRGLDEDPAARYASMDALLHALAREGPFAPRRIAAAMAVALLAGAAIVGVTRQRSHHELLCAGAASKLEGVWDANRKRLVEQAFVRTGKPFAGDAFREVERGLDAYTRAWAKVHTESCEATRVRGEQSDLILSLRMVCLEERREEVKALTDLFVAGDPEVVQRSVTATQALTKIDACSDIAALTARVKPPDDVTVRARVEDVRRELARAKALEDSGRFVEGIAVATTVNDVARELHYRPIEAEALFRLGMLQESSGDANAADGTLRDAVLAAEAAGDDPLATRAWIALVFVASRRATFDKGEECARHASAMLERAHGQEGLRAELASARGALLFAQGKFADAEAMLREALSMLEKQLGADHTRVAQTLTMLGNTLVDLDRHEEALATYARSLAIQEKALGPHHPDVAKTLNSIGMVHGIEGKDAEAASYFRRALDIWEETQGPDHRELAIPLSNLAVLLDNLGERREALALQERAVAIWMKTFGPEHPQTARGLRNLGEFLENLGDYAQARARQEQALAIREKVLGAQHRDVARSLDGLGHLALSDGKPSEALAPYLRSIAIFTKTLGADSPELSSPLTGLGRAYVALRRPTDAIAPLERALALRQTRATAEAKLAETRFTLARALWDSSRDRTRARELGAQALEGFTRAGAPSVKSRADVEAWLKARSPA